MLVRVAISTVIAVLTIPSIIYSEDSVVLWNEQCPCSFAESPEKGETFKKEIPDWQSNFRAQLEWPKGEYLSEPNQVLQKKIQFTKNILTEVFKPDIIPLDSIEKYFMLSRINFREDGPRDDVLFFRCKKDKYIIKVMKTDLSLYITARLVSGKEIELKQLSEEIFQDRILPYKWEKPFYLDKLKRKSVILVAGQWMPRDYMKIDNRGNIIHADDHLPMVAFGPVGVGPYKYKKVDFIRGENFACFSIIGGTYIKPPSSRDKTGAEKPRSIPPAPGPGGFGPMPDKYDPNSAPPPKNTP